MARGDFAKTHVELGPCECPGSPHTDGDWADVKDRLTFGDVRRVAGVMNGIALDSTAMMLARAVVAWDLVDEKGQPIPIPTRDNGWTDLTAIDGLSVEQSQKLRAVVDTEQYAVQLLSVAAKGEAAQPDPLPNRSSGPSADGSAETSTPTPTTSPTSSPTTS